MSDRQYVFEFNEAQDEWQVCSTADDHEIVCAKGFDGGFRALASWVLEREAFTRIDRSDARWVNVEDEDGDDLRVYGPAEAIEEAAE